MRAEPFIIKPIIHTFATLLPDLHNHIRDQIIAKLEKVKREYVIPFSGLKIGKHIYKYKLGDSFFQSFNNPELDKGKVNAAVELEKSENMLVLQILTDGFISTLCDRCGTELDQEIKSANRLIVKFSSENIQETDEIIVLPAEAFEINVSSYLYEFIFLALPAKRKHKKSECDQDALALLKELSTRKVNNSDPRWEVLKKLNKN